MIPGQAQQFFEVAAAQSGGDDTFKVARSLRFNSVDTTYLNRNLSSPTNRSKWTWSGWIKRSLIGDRQEIIAAGYDGTEFFFDSDDKLNFYYYKPGQGYEGWCLTSERYRDISAWYHIVLIFDSAQSTASNRVQIYVNNVIQTLSYTHNFPQYSEPDINNTSQPHFIGRYSNSNNELANYYLAETQLIDGQVLNPTSFGEFDENNNWNPKEFTGSYVPKELSNWTAQVSGNTYNNNVGKKKAFDGRLDTECAAASGGTLTFTPSSAITGLTKVRIRAKRDNNADTATIVLNGVDISSNWSNGQDKDVEITTTTLTSLAWSTQSNGQWFSVRRIEIYYDGAYHTLLLGGINSFYLKFADKSSTAALGTDSSGNSNTWTANNFSVAAGAGNDSLLDTPSNYTSGGTTGGNFCTWNNLSTRNVTFRQGNLQVESSGSGASGWRNVASTIAVSSGKWYAEFETVGSQNGGLFLSVQKIPEDNGQFNPPSFSNNICGMTANSFSLNCFSGAKRTNGSDASYGSGMSLNDIIMCAFDLDNGKIWWGKNGTWFDSGDPDSGTNPAFTGLTGTFLFAVSISSSEIINSNFGQRAYSYNNNISGFKSVCTQNLADPTVADGSTVFNAKTWTGTGSSHAITGYGFSPDFAWIKSRNNTASHALLDTVRGNSNVLKTEVTSAEVTGNTSVWTSFDSDGFTLGADTSNGWTNYNSWTYVGWGWDAGTSTVSNGDGSVTSQVRANASAGFSIVTATLPNYYTNYTIGHGLSATPHFIIGKNRAEANQWDVYHQDVGIGKLFRLNQTSAVSNATPNQDSYYPTAPTSSVFGFVGNNNTMNFVWYVFTEIAGYSAFGSYSTNGLSDGPYVNLGFRPRLLLLRTTSSADWFLIDTARDPSNGCQYYSFPNLSNQEGSGVQFIDILSNGFKYRYGGGGLNTSGQTIIYGAWAEHPFKTSRAR